jgi:hypothetical protein
MITTLSDGTTTVVLPADLYWSDEATWTPVEQSVERTIAGAIVIDAGTKVGGRPITLAPYDDQSAWMQNADLDQLRVWAQVPLKVLTLNRGGTIYSVMFRHQDQALDVRPVVFYSDADSTDNSLVTIRLMDVTP